MAAVGEAEPLAAFNFLLMEIERDYQGRLDADTAYRRQEELGVKVGQSFFELLTSGRPRFRDELEIVKHICKEFWSAVFGKSIDNLRTNHKGVYVLQDDAFPPFTHIARGERCLPQAQALMAFPCGLIRGSLAAVGLTASVKGETSSLPACRFTLDIKGSV